MKMMPRAMHESQALERSRGRSFAVRKATNEEEEKKGSSLFGCCGGEMMNEDDAEGDEDLEELKKCSITLGKLRESLLQDIYDALPNDGFQLISFSSIDDDEIF